MWILQYVPYWKIITIADDLKDNGIYYLGLEKTIFFITVPYLLISVTGTVTHGKIHYAYLL